MHSKRVIARVACLAVLLLPITLLTSHSANAVPADGSVWAWGNGGSGQLGAGNNNSNATPAQVTSVGQVTDISAGCQHSLTVRSDQTVWTWGYNGFGQLGIGSDTNVNTPTQVADFTATATAGGCYHSLALKGDRTVWAWGNNSLNNLGIGGPATDTCLGFGGGGINCSKTPVQVSNLTDVTAIAAGITFNLALKADGTVWAWGQNFGSTPIQMSGLTDVTAVAAGSYHALAVRSDGTVWTWGEDLYEVLANGAAGASYTPAQVTGLTDVVGVSGGGWHSLALRSDGTVWGWGRNTQGQVGNGTTTPTGCNCVPAPVQTTGLGDVQAIAASLLASVALKTDGTVHAWGSNGSGEFGNGSFNAGSATPTQNGLTNVSGIASGAFHVLATIQNNQRPTADANGPYSVAEGNSINVGASGTDPDGDALTYAWDLDDNGSFETPGQTVSFSAATLTAPASRNIRVQVTDANGATAEDQARVDVTYRFGGFLQPVDSPPAFNVLQAGRAVPIKFSLGGDRGLAIFAAGHPVSQRIDCDTSAPTDVIEETSSAGSSGLAYDAATAQYRYTWKTSKAWAGTCRQLILRFDDGTSYQANFRLN